MPRVSNSGRLFAQREWRDACRVSLYGALLSLHLPFLTCVLERYEARDFHGRHPSIFAGQNCEQKVHKGPFSRQKPSKRRLGGESDTTCFHFRSPFHPTIISGCLPCTIAYVCNIGLEPLCLSGTDSESRSKEMEQCGRRDSNSVFERSSIARGKNPSTYTSPTVVAGTFAHLLVRQAHQDTWRHVVYETPVGGRLK